MEELQKMSHRAGGSTWEPVARAGFEKALEKIIADTSLVLFVTLSAGWIGLSVQAVGVVMLSGNWLGVVLLIPMVTGGVFLGSILWVWMGEVSGTGKAIHLY